ncbi:hypothetical protein I7I53_07773 [Histoplasma capsulatum var. duboisii H88]|uniref:Uncharacterized protein n=1 Tax=Ajellomyces capsulatus (strain H88) TaxID=544711 RepID=A0A8A1LIB9_AJEC8|nr:hypothetical protein I7I53_07773 [Histoplasma capsulatum var. duboisii H88]
MFYFYFILFIFIFLVFGFFPFGSRGRVENRVKMVRATVLDCKSWPCIQIAWLSSIANQNGLDHGFRLQIVAQQAPRQSD